MESFQFIFTCKIQPLMKLLTVFDEKGRLPLHIACAHQYTKKRPFSIVSSLVKACPETVRIANKSNGQLPLHTLLRRKLSRLNSKRVLADVKLLLRHFPGSRTQKDNDGNLPIQYAFHHNSGSKHEEAIVEQLIDGPATPLSATMSGPLVGRELEGAMPLHLACYYRFSLRTIKPMVRIYPDAANHELASGFYPLHCLCASDNNEVVG